MTTLDCIFASSDVLLDEGILLFGIDRRGTKRVNETEGSKGWSPVHEMFRGFRIDRGLIEPGTSNQYRSSILHSFRRPS